MKYLVVVLLLLGGRPTAVAPAPLRTAAAVRFVQVAAGVATTVTLYLDAVPGGTRLGVAIQQTARTCGQAGCPAGARLAGYTYRAGRPGEVLIDPTLRRASVHATLRFHDDGTQTDIPLRVDAVWTASGPLQCGGPDDAPSCGRAATVSGAVGAGPVPLIAGQTVPDGRLSWTRPPTSTTGP